MSPGPEDEEPPRPLLGATFWAMIAIGVLCVVAGIAVALVASRR